MLLGKAEGRCCVSGKKGLYYFENSLEDHKQHISLNRGDTEHAGGTVRTPLQWRKAQGGYVR